MNADHAAEIRNPKFEFRIARRSSPSPSGDCIGTAAVGGASSRGNRPPGAAVATHSDRPPLNGACQTPCLGRRRAPPLALCHPCHPWPLVLLIASPSPPPFIGAIRPAAAALAALAEAAVIREIRGFWSFDSMSPPQAAVTAAAAGPHRPTKGTTDERRWTRIGWTPSAGRVSSGDERGDGRQAANPSRQAGGYRCWARAALQMHALLQRRATTRPSA